MLEFIKNWVVAITVVVLIGAILELLLPQGSIKKYAKTAIAITIMLVIISPVIKLFNGEVNLDAKLNTIFSQPTLQQTQNDKENSLTSYKDYVYEVYMRNNKNKNE